MSKFIFSTAHVQSVPATYLDCFLQGLTRCGQEAVAVLNVSLSDSGHTAVVTWCKLLEVD